MSDRPAFEGFWRRVDTEIAKEYGPAAALDRNPYWQARNILEVILERFAYGNTAEPKKGHFGYNPASFKLRLLDDTNEKNDRMSCSTSAFALDGLLRFRGRAARWVGTSKLRDNWDKDKDGLWSEGERAVDDPFHRWPEVWLGERLGWLRFDPTPLKTAREMSQFELVRRSAIGVGQRDLCLTIGSGYEEPFFHQKDGRQRYNAVPRYKQPKRWKTLVRGRVIWENACFLDVAAPTKPVTTRTITLAWILRGRWDLDPTATLSIDLVGGKKRRIKLASSVAATAGEATVDLGNAPAGTYRLRVTKDGDAATGADSAPFRYQPPTATGG